jgi:hypothetical protein
MDELSVPESRPDPLPPPTRLVALSKSPRKRKPGPKTSPQSLHKLGELMKEKAAEYHKLYTGWPTLPELAKEIGYAADRLRRVVREHPDLVPDEWGWFDEDSPLARVQPRAPSENA